MKVLTRREVEYLRESRDLLADAGIIIDVPRPRRLTPSQVRRIGEAVLFIESNRAEMQRLGLPINEELQLEFLGAIAQGAAAAAKVAGPALRAASTAAAKGAKVAGQAAMKGVKTASQVAAKGAKAAASAAQKGAQAASKGAKAATSAVQKGAKAVGDAKNALPKDLMSAIQDNPDIQKAVKKAAGDQQAAGADAKKTLADVQTVVTKLPPEQQELAKKAGTNSLNSIKSTLEKAYAKMSADMGDPELAKMMMSASIMKLVTDMK
jgi:hypothetical protein